MVHSNAAIPLHIFRGTARSYTLSQGKTGNSGFSYQTERDTEIPGTLAEQGKCQVASCLARAVTVCQRPQGGELTAGLVEYRLE